MHVVFTRHRTSTWDHTKTKWHYQTNKGYENLKKLFQSGIVSVGSDHDLVVGVPMTRKKGISSLTNIDHYKNPSKRPFHIAIKKSLLYYEIRFLVYLSTFDRWHFGVEAHYVFFEWPHRIYSNRSYFCLQWREVISCLLLERLRYNMKTWLLSTR